MNSIRETISVKINIYNAYADSNPRYYVAGNVDEYEYCWLVAMGMIETLMIKGALVD